MDSATQVHSYWLKPPRVISECKASITSWRSVALKDTNLKDISRLKSYFITGNPQHPLLFRGMRASDEPIISNNSQASRTLQFTGHEDRKGWVLLRPCVQQQSKGMVMLGSTEVGYMQCMCLNPVLSLPLEVHSIILPYIHSIHKDNITGVWGRKIK